MGAHGLNILTFNVWGLLFISKQRQERVKHIATLLASSSADIVALQEVWVGADADALVAAAANGGRLIYSHRYQSGLFGPGLLLISRHPIVETAFHPFQVLGDPTKISGCDFYGSKGVGRALVRVPSPVGSGMVPHVYVDVLVTHTHANYDLRSTPLEGLAAQVEGQSLLAAQTQETASGQTPVAVPLDEDAGIRLHNMLQLGQLAAALLRSPEARIVVMGDLNSSPTTLEMALLRQLAPGLNDAWGLTHPQEAGNTCNVPENTWTKNPSPVRIDYVLSNMAPTSARVLSPLTPDGHSLSDHQAVEAELSLQELPSTEQCGLTDFPSNAQMTAQWLAAKSAMSNNIHLLQKWRKVFLSAAFFLAALGVFMFFFAFWGQSTCCAWDYELTRQLFEAHHRRLDRDKGYGMTPAGGAAADRLRAFLLATCGSLLAGFGFVLWLMAYLGLSSQIRALESSFVMEAPLHAEWIEQMQERLGC